jgi:hypothetical protein
MNRKRIQTAIALITLAVLLLLAGRALAASPADYALDWWTVDGGGGTWSDTGGEYVLNSTIGQPDAHVWEGDDYTLTGGFWGAGEVNRCVYLPLVLRND